MKTANTLIIALPEWISVTPEGCRLTLRVTPAASRSEVAGAEPGWLRVRLMAPPVDGKANQELIRFLAKMLKISKGSITICTGESSRLKQIKISGVLPEEFLARSARNP